MAKRFTLDLVCDTPECEYVGYYDSTLSTDDVATQAYKNGWMFSVSGDFCPWCSKYKREGITRL